MKEANSINGTLMCLGSVITAIRESAQGKRN